MATKEITFDGKNLSVGGKTIPVASVPKSPAPGKATGGGTPSGDSWVPWALGGGGALLAHAITSPMFEASDEEKRKESIWSKLLRTIIPLGVGGLGGVAGYALGNALNKKAQAKPTAQKTTPSALAAPAAPAAPVVVKATLPYPANVFKDSKGNPRLVIDGVSEDDYNDWIGRYLSDAPEELLRMRRGTMSNYSGLSHLAGKGLMGLGLGGGAIGALWPWVTNPKIPSSVELRDIIANIDNLRTKQNANKASLQRAHSAYSKAQRAVDTKAMGSAQKSIATAKGNIKATKKQLRAAEGKLPMSKLMRSARNFGVGSAFAGAGYAIDEGGDALGRSAVNYGNMAENQQAIDNAVRQVIDQYGQPAQPAQPKK